MAVSWVAWTGDRRNAISSMLMRSRSLKRKVLVSTRFMCAIFLLLVALVEAPQLLEVARTADVKSLTHALDAIIDEAEGRVASMQGSTGR